MPVAQSGIFAPGTGSPSYREFDLLECADPRVLMQDDCEFARTAHHDRRCQRGGRLSALPLEARGTAADTESSYGLEQDVRGVDGYTMPTTQHDLWPWVAGRAHAKVFDVTKEAMQALSSLAILALEVAGWTCKEELTPNFAVSIFVRYFQGTRLPHPLHPTPLSLQNMVTLLFFSTNRRQGGRGLSHAGELPPGFH